MTDRFQHRLEAQKSKEKKEEEEVEEDVETNVTKTGEEQMFPLIWTKQAHSQEKAEVKKLKTSSPINQKNLIILVFLQLICPSLVLHSLDTVSCPGK